MAAPVLMRQRRFTAVREHPYLVRVSHWLAAIATAILIPSGLEIFRAFPSFGSKVPQSDLVRIPQSVTLGGWLGGALQWHLAFAWLFFAAGICYVLYQAITGNYRQVMFARADLRGLWPMVRHYFLFGPKPPQEESYNALQKLAYTVVLTLGALAVISGAALWKPVQLSWLVQILGGFRLARVWHFVAMCGILGFIPGHLVMVALHGWNNFSCIWTGWKRESS